MLYIEQCANSRAVTIFIRGGMFLCIIFFSSFISTYTCVLSPLQGHLCLNLFNTSFFHSGSDSIFRGSCCYGDFTTKFVDIVCRTINLQ
jgi:hypothetical protein